MTTITKANFGKSSTGQEVGLYTLESGSGLAVRISDYGCAIQSLMVPDKNGNMGDVVLGYDDFRGYERDESYQGVVVGRVAGRIKGAEFTLDGEKYELSKNSGCHHLHGGFTGLHKRFWQADMEAGKLVLKCESAHGEDGYPGNLAVSVTYSLESGNCLRVEYAAETDRPTLCNLTGHPYFNLDPDHAGNCLGHKITINADRYTALDKDLIPTGEIEPVVGTPLDLRFGAKIGARLDFGFEQIALAGGFDHNFVLNNPGGELGFAAKAHDPYSGRTLEVHTTNPGIQFYSGNFLSPDVRGKGGAFHRHGGFCLEPQFFPDAPHNPWYDSVILRPGNEYRHVTEYRFSVE